MADTARWEGGHRARIQAQASFPGRADLRQDFARQEDRAVVNRTNNFLSQTAEDGPSDERFITIIPRAPIPGHRHSGNNCQTVAISCSAQALNELKRDPLLNNETEILHETNRSPTTSSNSNEVRVE